MEENLISKKELLELTGISYGALYRWKRKQLIPEDWFIKKSTFTGPETFFPREKVLERIAKIQEMKEQVSLDELAKQFSGSPIEIETTARKLIENQVVSPAVERLAQFDGDQELDFHGVLYYFICDELLSEGYLSIAETDEVLAHLLADYKDFETPPVLHIYRKTGVTFSALVDEKGKASVDRGVKQIAKISTAPIYEVLKAKWGDKDERNEA